MNYIYTNTRDNRQYILNPMITMGEKVCLVDMANCEDKFVSPKTLKRWYSKTMTDDIIVELRAFTGMKLGLFRVSGCSLDGKLIVWTKNNKCLTFDPDMGNQTNAKNPKFANRVYQDYNFMECTLRWALS